MYIYISTRRPRRRNQQPLPCAQGYKHARQRRRRRRLQRRRRRTGQPPCPLADRSHTKHRNNKYVVHNTICNDTYKPRDHLTHDNHRRRIYCLILFFFPRFDLKNLQAARLYTRPPAVELAIIYFHDLLYCFACRRYRNNTEHTSIRYYIPKILWYHL